MAGTKEKLVREICELAGVGFIPLGPGSKEKKAVFTRAAQAFGYEPPKASKPEVAEWLARQGGLDWDDSCESVGDTVTAEGLRRVRDALRAVAEVRSPVRVANEEKPPPPADPWERYLHLGTAIAEVLYGESADGSPVYLDVEDAILAAILTEAGEARPAGQDRECFLEIVRNVMNPVGHSAGIFGRIVTQQRLHDGRVKTGTGDPLAPPPSLGLLAVLTVAAEDMAGGEGIGKNNYYDRLLPLLDVAPFHREKVANQYRDVAVELWGALNRWLERLDGRRGLPTAYASGHKFIGLPLSQALVRQSDREWLHQVFLDLGLPPRARMAPSDLEPLLKESIDTASANLRRLWRQLPARERIVEIAAGELEQWEPTASELLESDGTASGYRATVRLVALLSTFPSLRLGLNILGPVVPDMSTSLEIEGLDERVTIDEAPSGGWRLAEPDRIEPASLTDRTLELLDPATQVCFRRNPRAVVPLAKDELAQAYVEVERFSLGADGMVMCANRLHDEVAEALELVARPGFKTYEPGQVHGAAPGWYVLTGVHVLALLPALRPSTSNRWSDELQALSALSSSQLVFTGGLRLPGRLRRWLSSVPPELTAIGAEVGKMNLSLTDEENNVVYSEMVNGATLIANLSPLGLPDGTYEVSLEARSRGKPSVSKVRLRLRSPDSPAPPTQGVEPLMRDLASPFSVSLSASRDVDSGARGAISPKAATNSQVVAERHSPAWVGGRAGVARPIATDGPGRLFLPELGQPGCFTTGAHVLQYPTFHGRATSKWVVGRCKHCGLVRRSPATASGATKNAQGAAFAPVSFERPVLPPIAERHIDEDEAFAALCTLRAGPAGWLEQVALQVEPSGLFVDVFLRGLEALGHIEVERGARNLSPATFEVVEPTVCRAVDGSLFLTGRRSPRLVAAIGKATAELGGALKNWPQPTGPAVLQILGVAANELSHAMAASGFTLLDGADAARRMAAALPSLSGLFSELPTQPVPAFQSARRWDHTVARWVPARDVSSPGAYQLHGMTMSYLLRAPEDVENGTVRRADARTVKHLAGLWAGTPLVGYEPDQRLLYVPRGADLPGLYGRAAVLCSGRLPRELKAENLAEVSGTTTVLGYADVTPDVAHLISEAISS